MLPLSSRDLLVTLGRLLLDDDRLAARPTAEPVAHTASASDRQANDRQTLPAELENSEHDTLLFSFVEVA